jgi:hydrogenase expression/formation protein HypE
MTPKQKLFSDNPSLLISKELKMSTFDLYGKVPHKTIERIVFPNLGVQRPEVLVRPGHGLDNGVIDLGNDKVLIVTTDIIWIIHEFGLEDAAWASWHISGNDITTCGHPPQYIVAVFTVPIGSKEEDLEVICKVFGRETAKYGAEVVAGHTGQFYTCQYPTIGTLTMMTTCAKDDYVTPQMVKLGDVLVLTKGIGISPAASFARMFPNTFKKELGGDMFDEAWEIFYQTSSMEDALISHSVGIGEHGVTSMHDITEGGLYTGFVELAGASHIGLLVNRDDIFISPVAEAVCKTFDIDPYCASSLGSLLITVKPTKVDTLIYTLKSQGIDAFVIGDVKHQDHGVVIQFNGKKQSLEKSNPDSLWPAMFTRVQQGLK